MPVRGKIFNCLKDGLPDSIFKSPTSSWTSCACWAAAWRSRTSASRTSAPLTWTTCNWNKVIICTDADVDGYQIRTLILTMLYRLVPTLIEEGYVYIAESPLYEINSKEKTYFAYTSSRRTTS